MSPGRASDRADPVHARRGREELDVLVVSHRTPSRRSRCDHGAPVGQRHLRPGTSARGPYRAAGPGLAERVEGVDARSGPAYGAARCPRYRRGCRRSRARARRRGSEVRAPEVGRLSPRRRGRANGGSTRGEGVRPGALGRIPHHRLPLVRRSDGPMSGWFGYAYQSTLPVGKTAALIPITGMSKRPFQRPPTSGATVAERAYNRKPPTGPVGAFLWRRASRRNAACSAACSGPENLRLPRPQLCLAQPRDAEITRRLSTNLLLRRTRQRRYPESHTRNRHNSQQQPAATNTAPTTGQTTASRRPPKTPTRKPHPRKPPRS